MGGERKRIPCLEMPYRIGVSERLMSRVCGATKKSAAISYRAIGPIPISGTNCDPRWNLIGTACHTKLSTRLCCLRTFLLLTHSLHGSPAESQLETCHWAEAEARSQLALPKLATTN